MNDKLKKLRDAITGSRDREVQVDPDGSVHEATEATVPDPQVREETKPTKLAARTFGADE